MSVTMFRIDEAGNEGTFTLPLKGLVVTEQPEGPWLVNSGKYNAEDDIEITAAEGRAILRLMKTTMDERRYWVTREDKYWETRADKEEIGNFAGFMFKTLDEANDKIAELRSEGVSWGLADVTYLIEVSVMEETIVRSAALLEG